jgi:hypothetical protein
MRFRGRYVAALWGGLQLFACGPSEFRTADELQGVGGASSGGSATGGEASGGTGGESGSGGVASDGGSAGGDSTGGASVGGSGTGGNDTGGADTGGNNTGGSTGGSHTGGDSTGGVGTGGDGTGGTQTGGTGGTTEPQIPRDGLMLWLRADAGVTLTAGGVGIWRNQAESGDQATQTVDEAQPTLSEAGINGRPAIDFDGLNDFLGLPAGAGDFSAGLTVFVVAEQDTAAGYNAFLEFSNGSEIDDISVGRWQDNLHYEVTLNWLVGPPATLGEPQLATLVHGSEGSIQLRHNGTTTAAGLFALPANVERQMNFIGRSLYLENQAFDGRIGEILVYDYGMFPEELSQVESYLKERWF